MPLCSGTTKPCNRSCRVFLDADAIRVAHADGVLSFGVTFKSSYKLMLKVNSCLCSEPEGEPWDSD